MSSVKINFSELPEQAITEIQKGLYILENIDIIESESTDGGTKFVMSHQIVGTDHKVTYDNYKLFNQDGTRSAFGLAKLRTLIEANELDLEEITLPLLSKLLKGKRFKANITLNDKKYPQINFKDIYPLSYEGVALNQTEADLITTPTPTPKIQQNMTTKTKEETDKEYVKTVLNDI